MPTAALISEGNQRAVPMEAILGQVCWMLAFQQGPKNLIRFPSSVSLHGQSLKFGLLVREK